MEHQLLNPLVRLLDPVTNFKAKEILTRKRALVARKSALRAAAVFGFSHRRRL